MNGPDVYTVPEAAARLGVSDDTLYRMIKEGAGVPVIQVRGRMKIPRRSFERWLNSEPQPPSQTEAAPTERAA